MEAIIFLALFYGGIMLIGWFFEQIGKWNDERKRKIRDEVAQEVLPQTDITNELIENYKVKLQNIGYDESQKFNWASSYYRSRERKSYRELLGKCTSCNEGYLRVANGKYGKFIGCSAFPKCRYTQNLDTAKSEYKQKVNDDLMNLFNLAYS